MSRILIVDDEVPILKALQRVLRRVPCQVGEKTLTLAVTPCNTPADALAFLAHNTCDLIISDYRMPDMDGVEFLRRAKALQPDAARIILSGYADLNAITRALNEVGIERFIGKPWNDDELTAAIGQVLTQRALQLENRELANLVRMEMGDITPDAVEAARLERQEPGITQVNWGPDGAVILDPEFRQDP